MVREGEGDCTQPVNKKKSSSHSPRMETLDRNSSYILRLRIVDPMRMRRYESRSSPHSFTSDLAAQWRGTDKGNERKGGGKSNDAIRSTR